MHKRLLGIVCIVMTVGLRLTAVYPASAAGGCGISLEFLTQEAARAQSAVAVGAGDAAVAILTSLDEQFTSQLDRCDLLTFDTFMLDLKQSATATDGSFSIQYPSDWQSNLSDTFPNFVGLTSTVALLEALQSGDDLRAFRPGEIVAGILVSDELEGVMDAPLPSEPGGYAELLAAHLEAANLTAGAGFEPQGLLEFWINEPRGALALFSREVSDGVSQVIVLLFPLGDGLWGRVFATHAAGERARVLPTLFSVMQSVTLADEGTTDAPETDLLPSGVLTRYEGIPQSNVRDGMYAIGDPEAPVSLSIYSSFACPPCGTFNNDVASAPEVLEYVREGLLTVEFVPYYITGHLPNGEDAARAAVCAGEQGRFFEMKDALFSWQTLSDAPFTAANFSAAVNGLGLDEDAFFDCMGSPQTTATLEAAIELGIGAGVIGTPTVLINNRMMEDRSLDGILDMIASELE